MRRDLRFVCGGLLLAIFVGQALAADVLSSIEAARRVGEQLTVELVARSGGRNGEFQELYTTKDWKDDGCFILRFSPAARTAFAAVDISDVTTYHSSALWLKRNGRNPEKAESVEISNVQNYVKWNREKQVSGMLHEMSHAFHNLCLGDDHAGILAAYDQAMQRTLYDSVPAVEGGLRPAYAMNNEKEYFAEMTEAYFGRNDFYPFNREQLKSHDPVAYQLLEEAWLKPLAPAAADASN